MYKYICNVIGKDNKSIHGAFYTHSHGEKHTMEKLIWGAQIYRRGILIYLENVFYGI